VIARHTPSHHYAASLAEVTAKYLQSSTISGRWVGDRGPRWVATHKHKNYF